MIGNELNPRLGNQFNRSGQPGKTEAPADAFRRLKAKGDAIRVGGDAAAEKEDKTPALAMPKDILELGRRGPFSKAPRLTPPKTAAKEESSAGVELSPEERRRKELKDILDKINAEEAEKRPPAAVKPESDQAEAKAEKWSGLPAGLSEFLNDMPLFDEFKASLADAFRSMDKANLGSISAQYELNVTSMRYISDAAGGFEYKESSFNLKLDFNYLKAAAGASGNGRAMADRIGQAGDFASLVEVLQSAVPDRAGQAGQTGKAAPAPDDFLAKMKDYFSPEKTAERIVDFAAAFFPSSRSFKANGDTEEARGEFAETMRQAIQKGFDQALGVLGKTPKAVRDDIDRTRELTFKGIDDFVKNGLNRQKGEDGLYAALEQWNLSISASYSEKTVSARGEFPYGAKFSAPFNQAPALDQQV